MIGKTIVFFFASLKETSPFNSFQLLELPKNSPKNSPNNSLNFKSLININLNI